MSIFSRAKEKPLNLDVGRTQGQSRASEKESGLVPPILDNIELGIEAQSRHP
jgi:hypothetical protein